MPRGELRTQLIETLTFQSERVFGPRIARLLTGKAYEGAFFGSREWRNLAYGVFSSFDDAEAFCRSLGVRSRYELDHGWWAEVQQGLKPHDYPVLFWLSRLITRDASVLDVGGSVGVSYYAYRRVIPDAATLSWRVLELPDVAAKGRQIASERGCSQLSFVSDWRDAKAAQVLLCAGTAQFLPEHLFESLSKLQALPPYAIINRVPVHDAESFVTLQNTGSAIAPCRVYARTDLVSSFERLGYTLLDEWQCLQNSLRIPYRPDYRLRAFAGFCFALEPRVSPLQ